MVIAEVAQAHDGSLGTALAFIDIAADAGADAIKFQTHIADAESSPGEPWRVKFSHQDKSRFDYWKRMEFEEEHWRLLKTKAQTKGLKFTSSPFSIEAVELLKKVGVDFWKIASGELSNRPMLDAILETKLPIVVSSGMSSWQELDEVVEPIRSAGVDLTILQCTTMYPTPPEKLGLNLIPEIRKRYGCKVGLSDHSGTIYAGLAAATLGINAIEVHITMHKKAFGPDVVASLTGEELSELVHGIRFIETALAHPINKDEMATEMQPLRDLFTKSLVVRKDLKAGSILQKEDLTAKKPGTGIPASQINQVVGKTLSCSIKANSFLKEADLEMRV